MAYLPFLKKLKEKQQSQQQAPGIATEYRSPDPEGEGHNDKESNKDEGLLVCARYMIECIKSDDEKGAASAIRSIFEILESEPHEEYPHDNESEDSE